MSAFKAWISLCLFLILSCGDSEIGGGKSGGRVLGATGKHALVGRKGNGDLWGKVVWGVRCGIRVNRVWRPPWVELEYVLENISFAVLAFHKEKPWRFTIIRPDGKKEQREPGGLLGSKCMVYMRPGDRVRGIIRSVDKCLGISSPGRYKIRVSWIAGPAEVSSDWVEVEIGKRPTKRKKKVAVGGQVKGKLLEGVYYPPRKEWFLYPIRHYVGPADPKAWGEIHDGIRVALVAEPFYELGKEIILNFWIKNVSAIDITYGYLEPWDLIDVKVFAPGGTPVPKTDYGSKVLDKSLRPRKGSFRKETIAKGETIGRTLSLSRLFRIKDPGVYEVELEVSLSPGFYPTKSTRKAKKRIRITVVSKRP